MPIRGFREGLLILFVGDCFLCDSRHGFTKIYKTHVTSGAGRIKSRYNMLFRVCSCNGYPFSDRTRFQKPVAMCWKDIFMLRSTHDNLRAALYRSLARKDNATAAAAAVQDRLCVCDVTCVIYIAHIC